MQREILAKYPSAPVHVYAIWFSMIPTDRRSMWRWSGDVLSDPRVAHFWDEQKIVGRWFSANGTDEDREAQIIWDAYYLYGPDAEWKTTPQPLIGSGGTVRDLAEELEQKLAPMLTKDK